MVTVDVKERLQLLQRDLMRLKVDFELFAFDIDLSRHLAICDGFCIVIALVLHGFSKLISCM